MSRERSPDRMIINIYGPVLCSYCNADYTESEVSGGGIVGSDIVCPECIGDVYRRGGKPDVVCPEGVPFKEFFLLFVLFSVTRIMEAD